jgi:hypothetical protein
MGVDLGPVRRSSTIRFHAWAAFLRVSLNNSFLEGKGDLTDGNVNQIYILMPVMGCIVLGTQSRGWVCRY